MTFVPPDFIQESRKPSEVEAAETFRILLAEIMSGGDRGGKYWRQVHGSLPPDEQAEFRDLTSRSFMPINVAGYLQQRREKIIQFWMSTLGKSDH